MTASYDPTDPEQLEQWVNDLGTVTTVGDIEWRRDVEVNWRAPDWVKHLACRVGTAGAFEAVVDALERAGCQPKWHGNDKVVARCPNPEAHSHGDRTPSLEVGRGDEAAVMKCFGGCDTRDVIDRLGLSMSDLFDRKRDLERRRRAAEYPYTDEQGQLLFTVVRFDPKGFAQKRADGTWKMDGVRRVIYRLPAVRLAAVAGADVIVTEGEKDADAVVRDGLCGTTAPGGAGKWRPEYAEHFREVKRVLVVADRDLQGYRHARDIARSLASVVGEVMVLEAAHGKDVAEHLGGGLPFEQLVNITDELDELCADGAEVDDDGEGEAATIGVAPDGHRLTDAGNAQRLIEEAAGAVRYVHEWGRWIVWQGGRWDVDAGDALVMETAKRVPAKLLTMSIDTRLPQEMRGSVVQCGHGGRVVVEVGGHGTAGPRDSRGHRRPRRARRRARHPELSERHGRTRYGQAPTTQSR